MLDFARLKARTEAQTDAKSDNDLHKAMSDARAKLQRKRVPLIVGNLGPATFGKDDNALLLVDAEHARPLPADGTPTDKLTLARELMAELAHRLSVRH